MPKGDGIHPLTQVILSVFRFLQLNLEGPEAVFAVQKAHALHVRHALALAVVDAVGEVHLVREKDGLRGRKGHYGGLARRSSMRTCRAEPFVTYCM